MNEFFKMVNEYMIGVSNASIEGSWRADNARRTLESRQRSVVSDVLAREFEWAYRDGVQAERTQVVAVFSLVLFIEAARSR